jgi:threonine dehydrogenase-like Zn-dependent dehydrogenase
MKAIWLEGGEVRLRDDLPRPHPTEGEALVRVLLAGICNTDLELIRGYHPFRGVPGHEFVGVVESGPDPLRGLRVAGEINAVCGACEECTEGLRSHCRNRTVLGIVGRDGAFAEYLTLPFENLHALPDGVPDDAAVFVEPLAAALQIVQQGAVRPGDRVLVVGDGKLGLLAAQAIALEGCEVVAVGRHASKLAVLAGAGIAAGEPDDVEARSFDVAVECTGNADGFRIALGSLRPRGTLVLKSTYKGELAVDAAPLVVDEIRVLGSRCGPFAPAIRLLERRRIETSPLVHARYPLDRGVEALDHAARPGALKVLLEIGSEETGRPARGILDRGAGGGS